MSGHATATVYQTIEAVPNTAALWSQSIEFYYKIGDASEKPEWHGNLLIQTDESNVPAGAQEMNLGFLLKLGDSEAAEKSGADSNWKNGWDGIDCVVRYDKESAEDVVFTGEDIFIQGDEPPNYAADPAAVRATDILDPEVDWTVNPVKSYFSCQAGQCMINMHFWRMYETDDANDDHQLMWGTSTNFKAVTFYSAGSVQAQSDPIEVMTLSAMSGVVAASLAIVAAML